MKIAVDIVGERKCVVSAYKCKRPKMSFITQRNWNHRGRTWDSIGTTEKGQPIFCDTTWGHYGYFRDVSGQWYKFCFDLLN